MDPKKQTPGQERRASYLQSTLREIREKRLSYDASGKGFFPQRTPSRLLSPPGVGGKKEVLIARDRPTLSLTKLDFELLREWDWKERQKRLETWGEDLGLTKTHRHFKHSNRDQQQDDYGTSKREKSHHHHHGRKSKKGQEHTTDTSAGILKKELEHLTGLKVYAPGDTGRGGKVGKGRRSILKHPSHLHLPPVNPNSSTTADRKRTSAGSFSTSRRRHSKEVPNVRHRKLENLMKEANEALESKKTFGKGWGAEAKEKQNRRSLTTTVLNERPSQITVKSIGSEATNSTTRKHTHGHYHRHSHQHLGSSVRHHPLSTGTAAPSAYKDHHRSLEESSRYRTDVEEEQPSTSYKSSNAASRKSTRATTSKFSRGQRHSSSASTPSDSAGSIGFTDLFRGIRTSLEEDSKSDEAHDGGTRAAPRSEPPDGKKYKRPPQPVEYQDTCFGGIQFVDRSAVKPLSKVNKGFDFVLTIDDPEIGQGSGGNQQLRVQFFKNKKTGEGHRERALAAKAVEKARKAQEKEEKMLKAKTTAAGATATPTEASQGPQVIQNFSELPTTGLLDLTSNSGKNRTERMMDFEKALMNLPGISSRWHMVVSATTGKSSIGDVNAVGRISRRNQFLRPPRRIWYTPLPLAIKRYYRTNWKKIRFDMRKLMKDQQFWPKLWINFEESHPQKLYELIKAKLAVKDFDQYGFKRVFDWGRGVHPDYIDWILADMVPHPGKYYYNVENLDRERKDAEAVRRASVEETDFRLKEWFIKPPRYIPDTPLSPPFDHFDFCGYGNRDRPFFLAFTLPREILHYYAPPSKIQQFFRQIPKPTYSFPGYTFKRWLNYPLDQKLPQYYPFPSRFMVWTKGKVGEPVQCNSNNFYNDDPYLRKRDNTYSPYHDGHTRKYILRKDILDKVWQLGIINSKGEVMCNMTEFNRNRMYLREYEWLEEALRRWDQSWNERQERNALTKVTNFTDLNYEGKKRLRETRLAECRRLNRIRDNEKQLRFRLIWEKTRRAMEQAEKKRFLQREKTMAQAREKQSAQLARKNSLVMKEVARISEVRGGYENKSKNAQEYRKWYHLKKLAEKSERQRDRWERQVQLHEQQVRLMKSMENRLDNEYRMKTQQRKLKAQALWRDIPYAILRKKMRENRANMLAIKWGRIWLQKVRERRKYSPDFEHVSVWTHAHILEHTVKELKKSSGYLDISQSLFLLALHQGLPQTDHEARPKGRKGSTGASESDHGANNEDDYEDYLGSGENSDEDPDRKKLAAAKEEEWNEMNKSDGYEADEDEEDGSSR